MSRDTNRSFYTPYSDLRPGADRQGQDRHVRPLRHRPGGQVQEEDQDGAAGTQSGVEREILLVSMEKLFPFYFISTDF